MRAFRTRLFGLMISAALVAGSLAGTAIAQNTNAVGTWKLNLAKSKYNPGPAPQSMTITWAKDGDALKYVGNSVAADGKAFKIEYTAKPDGKNYPLKGSPIVDTISVKEIDANTVERTDKKGEKVVYVLRRTIIGNVMTVTVKGTSPTGQPVDHVLVFDKQ